MYNRFGWNQQMWEEERRLERQLLRDVTDDKQPMSWRKFGKMIQLNAMLRSHDRGYRGFGSTGFWGG
ncbi:MAG: hypothetical protein FWE98_01160 [Oscillospiraceae bacterium]|nr:hypothetical protein [Oscillospiraceae bacterium]